MGLRRAVGACLFALVVGAAAPAAAEPPKQWLPDADLFCEVGGDYVKQDAFTVMPSSSTLWITNDGVTTHYVITSIVHYWLFGALSTQPLDGAALSALPSVTSQLGAKRGLVDVLACQVVSRLDYAPSGLSAGDLTIHAEIAVAPSGRG